jgi:hypothetical protein
VGRLARYDVRQHRCAAGAGLQPTAHPGVTSARHAALLHAPLRCMPVHCARPHFAHRGVLSQKQTMSYAIHVHVLQGLLNRGYYDIFYVSIADSERSSPTCSLLNMCCTCPAVAQRTTLLLIGNWDVPAAAGRQPAQRSSGQLLAAQLPRARRRRRLMELSAALLRTAGDTLWSTGRVLPQYGVCVPA